MILLVQHFNGTKLGVIPETPRPLLYASLTVGNKRYLVHWIREDREGIQVGVEDITPSGGCGG